MARNNTSEQLKVIKHPIGVHAKVLAVAGSGKTTTMVERVKHLIIEEKVSPSKIQILMFNKMASDDFSYKLRNCGLEQGLLPSVNTFHSIALRVVFDAQSQDFLDNDFELWTEDKREIYRNLIYDAFNQLRSERQVEPHVQLDRDTALAAIDFWKSSLIKAENAGWKGEEKYHLVYGMMEGWRVEKKGLTFDDMIVTAVDLLQDDTPFSRSWKGRFDHIIVDEYQDINYAQQKMVELLVDGKADVMVVGDDDQTIYEWRGARPNYILGEFEKVFNNKLLMKYTLSHSFRFGPTIAQYAENCISNNHGRQQKSLISFWPGQGSFVKLIDIRPEQETNAAKEMVEVLRNCVQETKDAGRVVVLVRSYLQLCSLQAELINQRIPHRIEGSVPLYERREIRALRYYLTVALLLDVPINEAPISQFMDIINYPKRYLKKADIESTIKDLNGPDSSGTFAELLRNIISSKRISRRNSETLADLLMCLEETRKRIVAGDSLHDVVKFIIGRTEFLKQFENYYGKGKHSLDRMEFVVNFLATLRLLKIDVRTFLNTSVGVDTSFGFEKEHQIVMTTIHRTKGLEFDYVFIPNCDEGFMPAHAYESEVFEKAYDKSGKVQHALRSFMMENERRLFYVAITRARKGVIISSKPLEAKEVKLREGPGPSRFLSEATFEPTRRIMDSMTNFAVSQNDETESKLKKAVRENKAAQLSIKNLHAHYLKDMGCEALSEEIARIAEEQMMEIRKQEKIKADSNKPSTTQAAMWWDQHK